MAFFYIGTLIWLVLILLLAVVAVRKCESKRGQWTCVILAGLAFLASFPGPIEGLSRAKPANLAWWEHDVPRAIIRDHDFKEGEWICLTLKFGKTDKPRVYQFNWDEEKNDWLTKLVKDSETLNTDPILIRPFADVGPVAWIASFWEKEAPETTLAEEVLASVDVLQQQQEILRQSNEEADRAYEERFRTQEPLDHGIAAVNELEENVSAQSSAASELSERQETLNQAVSKLDSALAALTQAEAALKKGENSYSQLKAMQDAVQTAKRELLAQSNKLKFAHPLKQAIKDASLKAGTTDSALTSLRSASQRFADQEQRISEAEEQLAQLNSDLEKQSKAIKESDKAKSAELAEAASMVNQALQTLAQSKQDLERGDTSSESVDEHTSKLAELQEALSQKAKDLAGEDIETSKQLTQAEFGIRSASQAMKSRASAAKDLATAKPKYNGLRDELSQLRNGLSSDATESDPVDPKLVEALTSAAAKVKDASRALGKANAEIAGSKSTDEKMREHMKALKSSIQSLQKQAEELDTDLPELSHKLQQTARAITKASEALEARHQSAQRGNLTEDELTLRRELLSDLQKILAENTMDLATDQPKLAGDLQTAAQGMQKAADYLTKGQSKEASSQQKSASQSLDAAASTAQSLKGNGNARQMANMDQLSNLQRDLLETTKEQVSQDSLNTVSEVQSALAAQLAEMAQQHSGPTGRAMAKTAAEMQRASALMQNGKQGEAAEAQEAALTQMEQVRDSLNAARSGKHRSSDYSGPSGFPDPNRRDADLKPSK